MRFRVSLEGIQRAVPEPAHLLELGDQGSNRVLAGRSKFVYLFATVFSGPDETGFFQHSRMFDDGGTAYRESPGQGRGPTGVGSEAAQQFAAGRVGQRGDGVINLHG